MLISTGIWDNLGVTIGHILYQASRWKPMNFASSGRKLIFLSYVIRNINNSP